jgi:CARDB/Secretion system C-terminal sorting domain
MKKLHLVYFLFLALLGIQSVSKEDSSGYLFFGYTGAPSEGICSDCHNQTGTVINGNITVTGFPTTIVLGQSYPITVTLTYTANKPATNARAGFQSIVVNSTGESQGSYANMEDNVVSQNENGHVRIVHFNAKSTPIGSNSVTYLYNWVAPTTGSGTLTMYIAGNLTNGNGETTGDKIVSTTKTGTIGTVNPCVITATTSNIVCNNAGTPTVTTDDTYTFTLLVNQNGNCTGNWFGGGGSPGTFGVAKTMGPYLISAGNQNFSVTTSTGQSAGVSVTAPAPCSSSSMLKPNLKRFSDTYPLTATAGQTISTSLKIKNDGTAPAVIQTTRVYISTDTILSLPADKLLRAPSCPALAIGLTQNKAFTLPFAATLTSGTYYLITKIDALNTNAELNETDNISWKAITITGIPQLISAPEQIQTASFEIVSLQLNPATTETELIINRLTEGPAQIQITDINGRVFFNKTIPMSTGMNAITLQTNELASGLYILHFIDESGNHETKQLWIK